MTNHPAPCPPHKDVRHDIGAWISGPGIVTEPVAVRDLHADDALVLDDGTVAEVDVIWFGDVRLPGRGQGPGARIWWKQRGGTASGVMVRRESDTVTRLAEGGAR